MGEKKKKVLMLLGSFGMGGAEHMVYELIKNLPPNEIDASVLCYGEKRHTPLEEKVEKICSVEYLNFGNQIGLREMFLSIRHIAKLHPDIVHAHMGGAGFAAVWSVLFSKPLIVTIHTSPEKAFGSKVERIIRFAMKKNRSCLVAVSSENYRKACNYFSGSDIFIQYVNNGIDIRRFTREPHGVFTFINVARQDENKNQMAILQAFAEIYQTNKNVRLLLVGDGPCRENLEMMVQDCDLETVVSFTGVVADPAPYYGVSDVYVQSSHREAMPLSVLEAMAAGLPIVSTDVGGIRDVVEENGILVPDNDITALKEAMTYLMYEPEEIRNKRSECSKRIVASYSSEEMAIQYMRIYERAIDDGR